MVLSLSFKLLVMAVVFVIAVNAADPPCSIFQMNEVDVIPFALDSSAITLDATLDSPNGEVFVKWCILDVTAGRSFTGRFYTPPSNPSNLPPYFMESNWKKLVVGVSTTPTGEFQFKINPSAFIKLPAGTAGLSDIVETSGQQGFYGPGLNPTLAALIQHMAPGYVFECENIRRHTFLDLTGTGWRVAPPTAVEQCGADASGERSGSASNIQVSIQASCGWIQYGGCTGNGDNVYAGGYRIPIERFINIDPAGAGGEEEAILANAQAQYTLSGVTWNIPAWQANNTLA